MLVYFQEFVRSEYDSSPEGIHTEPILVNTNSIAYAKTSAFYNDRSIIHLNDGRAVEVNGDLETLREFIKQAEEHEV